jgi:hypothetical protein
MNREKTAETPANALRTAPTTTGKRRQWSVVSGQWSTRRRRAAFTLAELLVSMGVLVLLVLLFTQLLNSAATVTILGHKQMDADSEARQVFDRMAIDFAQMVKRADVDCYVKALGQQTNHNDQIAFYSAVPGYYPSGSTSTQQSPLSLVAYRVNSNPASPSYNKLERMGKGLVWNGVSTTDTPVVFAPVPIASPSYLPPAAGTPLPAWPEVASSTTDWSDSEVIGPDVFRFEYFFMLKDGSLKEAPCWPTPCSLSGWRNVAAIAVAIAVIDPRSKVLLTNAQIVTLNTAPPSANFLDDFDNGMSQPGALRNNWQNKLNGITTLPRQAVSGIRVYERYFYLSQ